MTELGKLLKEEGMNRLYLYYLLKIEDTQHFKVFSSKHYLTTAHVKLSTYSQLKWLDEIENQSYRNSIFSQNHSQDVSSNSVCIQWDFAVELSEAHPR